MLTALCSRKLEHRLTWHRDRLLDTAAWPASGSLLAVTPAPVTPTSMPFFTAQHMLCAAETALQGISYAGPSVSPYVIETSVVCKQSTALHTQAEGDVSASIFLVTRCTAVPLHTFAGVICCWPAWQAIISPVSYPSVQDQHNPELLMCHVCRADSFPMLITAGSALDGYRMSLHISTRQ